ncbi:arginyl-tRNA synthetase [Hydrogenobacter thermophilus TK-6]|uniref:Arginine--tRNA ligase n=1 Tax=Hydrogenobacter thermophilus (strain DSM 6534 / IAM 12695 / TK-6) TaxID=608538 RepID=D3DKI9_HYDTT|nr:arginine--tRNA ligase [Hydrogenobacter thermophilus]ADO46259.1 arginyl-tRNA synthetase [Hydrogenobacter thermophilus TK-6]BAI70341.1 arginyl-tRNA synthetase [Hydrogenobacter thermophilus TK-6]
MRETLESSIKETIKEIYGINIEGFTVEKPKEESLGDLSTNVAFLVAKELKINPKDVAQELAKKLSNKKMLAKASGGFINFTFSENFWREEFEKLLKEREKYFVEDIGKGESVQIEFVSANPTGPLHLGHGRGAVVGDVLANLLETYGYRVVREYYINDAGYQVYLLGLSVFCRYMELFGQEDAELKQVYEREGYKGSYIKKLAEDVKAFYGDALLKEERQKAIERLRDYAVKRLLEEIRDDLELLNIKFDVWYSERSLYEEGKVEQVINLLRERGYTYEKDQALWFRSTDFGDDKDRVLIRSDGTYTYFASDVAYHWEKYKRGFARVINVWGADHHGYLPRLKGALSALGVPQNWLHVQFVQMVRLFSAGQEVRMSKRTGEFVTLRELVEEVGSDAVRFTFLTKRSDTPLDFDIDLLKKKSSENPVFYVQYMHARIRGVFREVLSRFGIDADKEELNKFVYNLREEQELKLVKKAVSLKDSIKEAALRWLPHIITYELIDLAKDFHNYYNHYRVIVEDREVMLSRLALFKGIETSVKFALKLMKVSAPERM